MNRKHSGFGTVEVIIILFIATGLVAVSWYILEAKHKSSNLKTSQSTTDYSTETYKSPKEGFTVEYPASWTASNTPDANYFSDGLAADILEYGSFTNPTGITLYYTISKTKPVVDPIKFPNYYAYPKNIAFTAKGLPHTYIYFVTSSPATLDASVSANQHIGISQLDPTEQLQSSSYPYYDAINNPGYYVSWSSFQVSFFERADSETYTFRSYSNRDDVHKAEQILKSISY